MFHTLFRDLAILKSRIGNSRKDFSRPRLFPDNILWSINRIHLIFRAIPVTFGSKQVKISDIKARKRATICYFAEILKRAFVHKFAAKPVVVWSLKLCEVSSCVKFQRLHTPVKAQRSFWRDYFELCFRFEQCSHVPLCRSTAFRKKNTICYWIPHACKTSEFCRAHCHFATDFWRVCLLETRSFYRIPWKQSVVNVDIFFKLTEPPFVSSLGSSKLNHRMIIKLGSQISR